MSLEDLIEDVTNMPTDEELEDELETEPEGPYFCGHWVSTYEENGKFYCGICGAIVE
jgi:hypothetical protein